MAGYWNFIWLLKNNNNKNKANFHSVYVTRFFLQVKNLTSAR